MAPASDPCPGIADVERIAGGEHVPPQVSRHVEACERCAALVRAAREDAEFVDRVKRLAGPALGPEGAPRVAGYRTLGVVSSGAQGVVYKAMQESTSRTVAIKVLTPGDSASPRQRLRAEREAEIVARLRHPNIVTVFESRPLSDGRKAVVMEYVDGAPLDAWKPPNESAADRQRELLRVFLSVCNGVHYAHLNGVIHRDLKPDNILVTPEGRPVVLDFGIAKAGGIRTTRTGEFAGTPAYASPEQASGRPDEVDALTDVYSLGVILYRLLCGAMPYNVEGSIFEIARTIGEAEPVRPRRRNPALSADLEAIVLRAIRKEKDRRYQSAAGLARDIERFLSGHPVEARSGSGWYLLRKAVAINRGRLAWAGAGLLLLSVAGAAVAISLARAAESAKRADLQREAARAEAIRARAVTELLREALPNADPSQPELGRVIGSGLARLFLRLETGAFADDPAVDQAIRRLWGGVYTGFGSGKAAELVEYAEDSLRSGLVRLRLEHGLEHPDIASTMQELAGVLLVRKRAPEAERFCREALAMRQRLLGPGSAPVADCRALLARILLNLGRADEAVREAEAALGVARTLPDREADLLIGSMTALKARALLDAGDLDGCEPLVREALVRRLRSLPPEDPALVASLADAADLAELRPGCGLAAELRAAWGSSPESAPEDVRRDLRLLAASDRGTYQRSIRTGRALALGHLLRFEEALLGPNDPALVGVLITQMRAAEGERLSGIKSGAALRVLDILSRRFGPDDMSVLFCTEEAATVLALVGHPEQGVALAQRACAIRDAVPAPARDHLLAANSRRLLGWQLALAGRHEEAIAAFRRALAELLDAVGPDHHLVALTESELAFSLMETGDRVRADEISAHALSLAERLPATAPDQLAHVRFSRGHILRALGRCSEAKAVLEKAWDVLFKCAGPAYAWRRVFIEDTALACEAMHDQTAAAWWRARIDEDCVDDPAPP